jgi:formylglycine-generating enzyme required for sulfatase activity
MKFGKHFNSSSFPSSLPSSVAKSPLMVPIPAGEFYMGTSEIQVHQMMYKEEWALEWYDKGMFHIEQPQHTLSLPAFEIGIFPVTNQEYSLFVWDSGYKVPKTWEGFHFPDGMGDYPVTGVSKIDAETYCQWLNKSLKLGTEYRLPTEAEWERAARGLDNRIYPWGDEFDPWRCNTSESNKRGTTPLGSYSPGGNSPAGVMDMVGNVWEWTTSRMYPYPYEFEYELEPIEPDDDFVLRGGSWYYTHKLARCSVRESALASYTSLALGFRIAMTIKPEETTEPD